MTGRQTAASTRPLYARVLGLRHVRVTGFLSFALFECVIALAVLLGLAELVSWWAVVVLPGVVAVMVKVNDAVTRVPPRPGRGAGSGKGRPVGSTAGRTATIRTAAGAVPDRGDRSSATDAPERSRKPADSGEAAKRLAAGHLEAMATLRAWSRGGGAPAVRRGRSTGDRVADRVPAGNPVTGSTGPAGTGTPEGVASGARQRAGEEHLRSSEAARSDPEGVEAVGPRSSGAAVGPRSKGASVADPARPGHALSTVDGPGLDLNGVDWPGVADPTRSVVDTTGTGTGTSVGTSTIGSAGPEQRTAGSGPGWATSAQQPRAVPVSGRHARPAEESRAGRRGTERRAPEVQREPEGGWVPGRRRAAPLNQRRFALPGAGREGLPGPSTPGRHSHRAQADPAAS